MSLQIVESVTFQAERAVREIVFSLDIHIGPTQAHRIGVPDDEPETTPVHLNSGQGKVRFWPLSDRRPEGAVTWSAHTAKRV